MINCKGCIRENSTWDRNAREICNHCKRAYAGADMDYHNDKYEAVTNDAIAEIKEEDSKSIEDNSTYETRELYRKESEFFILGIVGLGWFLTLLSYIF